MVGDDAHRPGHGFIVAVLESASFFGQLDQRREHVDLVDRRYVLEDRRHALEAHAGVDVLLRQRRKFAVFILVVGHEDVVPVLEESVGIVTGYRVGRAEVGAAVQVHFRAGPAGTGRAGLPEVLRAGQLDDALLGYAEALPDLDRLGVGAESEVLIAAEDRDPDLLRVEAESVDGEVPAERHRLFLEVVPEAEVAEHLEEGEVAERLADLFDVGGAEAGLA